MISDPSRLHKQSCHQSYQKTPVHRILMEVATLPCKKFSKQCAHKVEKAYRIKDEVRVVRRVEDNIIETLDRFLIINDVGLIVFIEFLVNAVDTDGVISDVSLRCSIDPQVGSGE